LGPLDLVSWLRTQGGLRDVPKHLSKGGDLKAMGVTNVARDLDFARNEHLFGKLIDNANGMNPDDAALAAWEAGYFPDHLERPDLAPFMEGVEGTYNGGRRSFLPDDLAEVDAFYGTQAERVDLQRQLSQGPVVNDLSAPA